MDVLVVSHEELPDLLPMEACIERIAEALSALARGQVVLPLRTISWLPDQRGALGLMPGYLGPEQLLGVKVISVFPGNAHTEYESHQGAVLLFEAEHGRLLGVIDAGELTAIRTAAASGLATRLLAREDTGCLALLGAGTQARTHLEAMLAVRRFAEVRIWSRSSASAEAFAEQWSDRAPIVVAGSAQQAVREADVICTLTAAREPILRGEWLAPGAHVNAVGACTPATRELDTEAVRRSRLFVDCRESALAEAGELLIPIAEGALAADPIEAELGQVLIGARPGRVSDEEITLFKSLGIALEDLAAAGHIYRTACETGAGRRVAIGGTR